MTFRPRPETTLLLGLAPVTSPKGMWGAPISRERLPLFTQLPIGGLLGNSVGNRSHRLTPSCSGASKRSLCRAAQRQAASFASVRISSMFSENHKVQMQDFL